MDNSIKSAQEVEVFYDGGCPLCLREIALLRRWDRRKKIQFTDIDSPSFQAEAGLITTKPYISGSSYILKMSNFRKGPWCPIWDALYWRFIDRHRAFFSGNPRMSVMVAQCDRMGSRLTEHLRTADSYLKRLHAE